MGVAVNIFNLVVSIVVNNIAYTNSNLVIILQLNVVTVSVFDSFFIEMWL